MNVYLDRSNKTKMLTKSKIKLFKSLELKKYRKQYGLFIAETPKVVEEILHAKISIKTIFALENWIKNNKRLIQSDVEIIMINQAELKKASCLSVPNEVSAIVKIPVSDSMGFRSLKNEITIALDGLSDPGNMGTIIRMAQWFGIKNVICSNDCVDVYNPKVVQGSMGAIAHVYIHYRDLAKLFDKENMSKIYGAVLNGNNIYKMNLKENGIILLGNEANGISKELLPFVTDPITIPSIGRNESLNVAIAASIICSEFRRNNI